MGGSPRERVSPGDPKGKGAEGQEQEGVLLVALVRPLRVQRPEVGRTGDLGLPFPPSYAVSGWCSWRQVVGSGSDTSLCCFSEVMSIWDSTSEYMLQQFALKKVGCPSPSSCMLVSVRCQQSLPPRCHRVTPSVPFDENPGGSLRCDGAASAAAGAGGEFVQKRLQAFLATTIPPCWEAEASRKPGALLRASAIAQRPTLKSVHSSKVFVCLAFSFLLRYEGKRRKNHGLLVSGPDPKLSEESPPSPLHLWSRQSTFVHPNLHLCSSALYWFQGVAVDVLGTFYILRKRICEGTRPMIVPRFHLSQRVAQAHGLIYTNSDIPGKALTQALLALAAVPACEFAVEERPRKPAVALQENISPGAQPLRIRCAKGVCLGELASQQHCVQYISPSPLTCLAVGSPWS